MTTSSNLSNSNLSQSHILVGVIIDVSSSMRRNWRNRHGKILPRIEAIRDTLNKWIREEQRTRQTQIEDIKMFCLGMGFKAPMYWTDVDCSDEQEHPLGNAAQKRIAVHLVCDLLALGEILPSREKLTEFKEKLNQRWVEYTKSILEKSVIAEDLYADLIEYVQVALYESAKHRLHQRLYYRLFHRFNAFLRRFSRIYLFLQGVIRNKEEKIGYTSNKRSIEFADSLLVSTTRDFTKNRDKYTSIVYRHLNSFVQSYVRHVLQALTIGFEIQELVEDLDETRIIFIAEQIYQELEKEVKKHIILTLEFHQNQLFHAKRSISASLNTKELQYRSKRFIQKNGWDMLKPLIEETVIKMFEQHFQNQSKESFPYWIRLATMREVARPFNELMTILPDILEKHIYTEELMFGSTPFKEALDKAATRLIDKAYQEREKALIIISDGEFQEESEIIVTANLLKRRGVKIISCLISEQNVFAGLAKKPMTKWPMGARLMVDVASKASETDSTTLMKKIKQGENKLPDKKLCIQINHSGILNDVLSWVFDSHHSSKTD